MPWVRTPAERREREEHAGRIVGKRLREVRYFEIDYRRTSESDVIQRGARLVTAAEEWSQPSWRAEGFDSLDYGLELVTTDGEVFCAVWEMAGFNAGLVLREEQLRPHRLGADGVFAIWEVHDASGWPDVVGVPVTDVRLYWDHPENPTDLCCHSAELRFGDRAVVLALAEERDGTFSYQPDNVAVVFGEDAARRLSVGRFGPPTW